ncbi:hypothetical protein Cob_v005193 [Colletotrichum orbiculare MAFF 240422]|uniref:Uncharacterized protein n=1 Tax=Colletotrichum orbiculare (strain 104-T / ATCC 96160 / CBS 514.97 / LARS 414 / MAFF 240422) TaxID=1213857 RepID=A0A484FWT1_COLOR|nr:hypothetical protein Cob_v005193 [Colletotrichum orbiculare MAFF 240422]
MSGASAETCAEKLVGLSTLPQPLLLPFRSVRAPFPSKDASPVSKAPGQDKKDPARTKRPAAVTSVAGPGYDDAELLHELSNAAICSDENGHLKPSKWVLIWFHEEPRSEHHVDAGK